MRILISGEGPNEVGSATQVERKGVIQAFVFKIRPDSSVDVREVVYWKDITKLRANSPGNGDKRNVRGLVLRAKELGCNAVIFLRDRDGRRDREQAIQTAAKQASREIENCPAIAAGVPIERLESWLLALKGVPSSETCTDPEHILSTAHGLPPKRTTAMVELVQNTKLRHLPEDAASLRRWLRELAHALRVRIPVELQHRTPRKK